MAENNFWNKHKQLFMYMIFGILTTVASFAAWYLTMEIGVLFWHDGEGEPTMGLGIVGSSVQWVVGVITAFITNKKWVFNAVGTTEKETSTELSKFAVGRLGTFGIESILYFGVVYVLTAMKYVPFTFLITFTPDVWAKAISSVVNIILNYVISKFFVFKKKQ